MARLRIEQLPQEQDEAGRWRHPYLIIIDQVDATDLEQLSDQIDTLAAVTGARGVVCTTATLDPVTP